MEYLSDFIRASASFLVLVAGIAGMVYLINQSDPAYKSRAEDKKQDKYKMHVLKKLVDGNQLTQQEEIFLRSWLIIQNTRSKKLNINEQSWKFFQTLNMFSPQIKG